MSGAEAKKRMTRKPKSGPASLPEQTGQTRDQAAKQLGVSGRSVSDAKRVLDDGSVPSNRGHVRAMIYNG